jgi:thymidylate kinase
VAAIGDWWQPDRMIVLTSSTATIARHIRLRSRRHEEVEEMVRRFQLIDAEFRRLAAGLPEAVVIDRDGREFHDRDDLVGIIRAARLPMFEEIPYRTDT